MWDRGGGGCCDGAVRSAWSDFYGGSLPLKVRSAELGTSPQAIFAAAFCAGLVTFFVVIVLFNFGLFFHQNEVIGLCEFVLIVNLAMVWNHRPSLERRSPLLLPAAVCSALAILLGSLLGTYCYDHYGYFNFMYANSRIYHNVVPSENAASMSDAGRVVFAPEAWVDRSKAAGYSKSGTKYCAAPVRGLEEPRRVEFWAVGVDCCGTSGSFTCDAAVGQAGGNATAAAAPKDGKEHGGVIVFDSPGLFGLGMKARYDTARKKAEAAQQLITAEEYIYVRWVSLKEVDSLTATYSEHAWLFIWMATVAWTVVSIPFAWLMSNRLLRLEHG